jgi:hypothetical protein
MTTDLEHPKIYTTADGQVVIEQSAGSRVLLSPEQILKVIRELHACYDYCAAWKEPVP